MTESLTPELERQAQELATRIHSRTADSILAMARRLVSCSEETLFGQTEFALRDHSHRIVADAYTEHLEKKAATSVPVLTVPSAAPAPGSIATAKKPSPRSAGRSRVVAPTTGVDPAVTANAPGIVASD